MTQDNKPRKSVSFKVQRRHQRIVALWNTAKRFSVGATAECLGVSRWTVERDMAFLRKYDLLSPKRACLPPFIVLEKGEKIQRGPFKGQGVIMVLFKVYFEKPSGYPIVLNATSELELVFVIEDAARKDYVHIKTERIEDRNRYL